MPEAESTIRQATEHRVFVPELLVIRCYIAYLRGDEVALEGEEHKDESNADVGDWIYHLEASILAYSGNLQAAREKTREAVDCAQAPRKRERAGMWEAAAAVREAFFGNANEARRYAKAALSFSREPVVEYGAALALALTRDLAGSKSLSEDLDRRFPENTSVQFNYLPTLRALSALSHRDSPRALAQLRTSTHYEMGIGATGTGLYGILYPVYMRGEADLAAHKVAEAVKEFQRILDHPGLVFTDPVGVMARLQLARALVLSGDQTNAKLAYRDFLTLWKDADPEIPILKQAKAEYAELY